MHLHIALFRPRPDLGPEDRASLVEALEAALGNIPSIRSCRVGRRVRLGTRYEAAMAVDLEYAAVLEFDDLAALQAYVAHPAHVALGARFMQSLEAASIYDYEMEDASGVRKMLEDVLAP